MRGTEIIIVIFLFVLTIESENSVQNLNTPININILGSRNLSQCVDNISFVLGRKVDLKKDERVFLDCCENACTEEKEYLHIDFELTHVFYVPRFGFDNDEIDKYWVECFCK
ncbi:hypothetical protein MHBO_001605 [Bonamia ostreae]|uniref:Uncharacterized protein n=1 Tax=Bonamia ostreae TaxID=126728 RepID=A0ABV2AJK9_9EUKA